MIEAIDPIAFSIGSIKVHWYGIILSLAALSGILMAIWQGKYLGVDSNTLLDLAIVAIPLAVVGARIYFVILRWNVYYSYYPEDILKVWKGGLAIHGALIASVIVGWFFARRRQIPFWRLADVAAPAILLGQAIGRWGNFMNQEAHGGPVSAEFISHFPSFIANQMYFNTEAYGLNYYHPTFLYESIWNLIGVLLLIGLTRLRHHQGEVFFSYLIWYSIGRFFIEGLRTDSLAFNGPQWFVDLLNALWAPLGLFLDQGVLEDGNIRMAQTISLVIVLISIILMVWRRRHYRQFEGGSLHQ